MEETSNRRFEEYKENLEKYKNFVDGIGKFKEGLGIARNSKYLAEIYNYLEKESDFFRSAINSYQTARKLMVRIKNLESLTTKLNAIKEKRKLEGKEK